ncbi:MAG: ketol-acid reductoisomerase, partial [Verrucomicrobiales bacterium]|nr:ketol-acid reductoisomerase [Verrucomicrobiales bacterium]
MAAKVITDNEASIAPLEGKICAVIGFGSQGHAHALNLRESGVQVVIGLYPDSKSRAVAAERGFEVLDTADAVKKADVIMIAVPDTVIPKVYENDVAPNLTSGKTLLFSHGFAVHFKTITPPDNVNVIMVAPKGPGHLVRRQYTEGKGVPTLIAVHNDATGDAHDIALAWAKGIGGTRGGVFETDFKEETETDLFGEQDVLMGGINHLCDMGFDVLTEAGYQPEIAYFEVFHELKMLVDLANEGGLNKARWSCSDTA